MAAVLFGWVIALIMMRRPWILMIASLAVGFATLAAAFLFIYFKWWPPSDVTLQSRLIENRTKFDHLAVMIEKDYQARPKGAEGEITIDKWPQYASLFQELSLREETVHIQNSVNLSFVVWDAEGLAGSWHSISYLHCGDASQDRLNLEAPCQKQKDSGDGKDEVWRYRYRKISDDWFIYEQWE